MYKAKSKPPSPKGLRGGSPKEGSGTSQRTDLWKLSRHLQAKSRQLDSALQDAGFPKEEPASTETSSDFGIVKNSEAIVTLMSTFPAKLQQQAKSLQDMQDRFEQLSERLDATETKCEYAWKVAATLKLNPRYMEEVEVSRQEDIVALESHVDTAVASMSHAVGEASGFMESQDLQSMQRKMQEMEAKIRSDVKALLDQRMQDMEARIAKEIAEMQAWIRADMRKLREGEVLTIWKHVDDQVQKLQRFTAVLSDVERSSGDTCKAKKQTGLAQSESGWALETEIGHLSSVGNSVSTEPKTITC